jgi:hypothetical protein
MVDWEGACRIRGGNNKGTCILKCTESLQPSVWNVRDGR